MRRYRFLVTIDLPDDFAAFEDGGEAEGIQRYIQESLETWCGSMDPDDDIFDIGKYCTTVPV